MTDCGQLANKDDCLVQMYDLATWLKPKAIVSKYLVRELRQSISKIRKPSLDYETRSCGVFSFQIKNESVSGGYAARRLIEGQKVGLRC